MSEENTKLVRFHSVVGERHSRWWTHVDPMIQVILVAVSFQVACIILSTQQAKPCQFNAGQLLLFAALQLLAASVPSVRPVRRPFRAVRLDPCGVRPERPTRAATVPSRPSRPERRPSRPVRLSNNYASNRARGIYKRSHMYMICVS